MDKITDPKVKVLLKWAIAFNEALKNVFFSGKHSNTHEVSDGKKD